MADSKVTALTEMTATDPDDVLMIVDDTAGTPTSQKIKVSNLSPRAFGQIYVTAGAGSQSLSAATWTKITQFTANSGVSLNTTEDNANDLITVANIGKYKVSLQASFSGGGSGTFQVRAYWNGGAQTHLTGKVKLDAGGSVQSCSFVGLLDVTVAATDVELYAYCDLAKTFVLEEAQLVIEQL